MSANTEYLTFCCREQWMNGQFYGTDCVGDSMELEHSSHQGLCCLPVVDSGEAGFLWDRLKLQVELPRDTVLQVYAYAGDNPFWHGWEDMKTAKELPEGQLDALAEEVFGPAVAQGPDCCLQLTGRYLWLCLELNATGTERPSIHRVSLRMSGDHMVDYLPAIYQKQDFTYRYLSIFNSMFQDMELKIGQFSQLLDKNSAPPEMLEYLAQWLCVDRRDRGEGIRERLAAALEEYETLYTVEGIKNSARRLSGGEPLLIEHFSVDPNRPDCCNPTLYRRLYGEDPYRFFLLLKEDTFSSRNKMEQFLERMNELIPAGTELELVMLKNCVQLDWHTYLGINSMVGNYIQAAIDERGTIHYDTTIGGTNHE